MFLLLGVLFLDHLLELVRFLAQLRKWLLYGIGFLYAFLSGTEIGFFHSVFLETTAIASIARRVRAPMLLAKVTVFLGTSFLWDSGTVVSTRSLCTLLLAAQSFLVARSVGFVGSFLAPSSRCAKLSHFKKRWTFWIIPGHIRARLPQETEGANACPRESHLSREGWTDPVTCTGMFVTRQTSLGERGLECKQSRLGHTLNSPLHCGLASLSLVGFGFLGEWTNLY